MGLHQAEVRDEAQGGEGCSESRVQEDPGPGGDFPKQTLHMFSRTNKQALQNNMIDRTLGDIEV